MHIKRQLFLLRIKNFFPCSNLCCQIFKPRLWCLNLIISSIINLTVVFDYIIHFFTLNFWFFLTFSIRKFWLQQRFTWFLEWANAFLNFINALFFIYILFFGFFNYFVYFILLKIFKLEIRWDILSFLNLDWVFILKIM